MNQPLSVLIIEDSSFDAMVMVNVLEQGGYSVEHEQVETRTSAQEMFARRRIRCRAPL